MTMTPRYDLPQSPLRIRQTSTYLRLYSPDPTLSHSPLLTLATKMWHLCVHRWSKQLT